MKSSIYDSVTLRCILDSELSEIVEIDSYTSEIRFAESDMPQLVTFNLEGEAYLVWGNRAGEGFHLNSVYPRLVELGYEHCGLSISYPATASVTAFLIHENQNEGFFCFMEKEIKGRIGEIRIKSSNSLNVSLQVNTRQRKWTVVRFNATRPLNEYFKSPSAQSTEHSMNFQLGLIDPYGSTDVPLSRGFHIIYDVAKVLLEKYGKGNNIIHIFGYGRGHDNFYPDYSPSELLGGRDSLQKAIKGAKSLGFKISCYLSARIIDKEALPLFPYLEEATLKNCNGEYLEEIYQDRTFYVMDPSSELWQKCLIDWGRFLYECGVDAVQLDQIGGRAAVKEIGEVWGAGYNRVIGELHKMGLKVWIQGVSDYYDADWFEMTYRDLKILDGGIIRGGNPFGEADFSLVRLFLSDKTFLIPAEDINRISHLEELKFITDYPDFRGELPLYSEEYMKKLNNAEAALR